MSDDPVEIVVWMPQPGPQTTAIQCPIEDLFYGGARGGGKTDFLLGDFLWRAQRFGAKMRGILFRRTYKELAVHVIPRALEIYSKLGWTYNQTEKDWRAPNGAVLHLRYLDIDSDSRHYQGTSLQWLGFDELGNWPSSKPIDELWACLRSKHGVPCVRRSTGNPGGPGHIWVKKRYRPESPYTVQRYRPQPKLRPDLAIETFFVPARLEDNLLLQEKDPHYERNLAASGTEALFQAWRYGNWDVTAGQFYDNFDPELHVVDARKVQIQPWHVRWISADWGFKDDCAIHWHTIDENRNIVTYRELVVNQTTPNEVGELIAKYTPHDKSAAGYERVSAFYLGGDAFGQRTSPRTIADEIGTILHGYGLPRPTRADDDRVGGWMLLYQLLDSGKWRISDACPQLIEDLPALQRDEKHLEDVAKEPHEHTHAPDSARYGMKTHWRSVPVPVQEQVKRWVEGRIAEGASTDPTAIAMMTRVAESKVRAGRIHGFRAKRRIA